MTQRDRMNSKRLEHFSCHVKSFVAAQPFGTIYFLSVVIYYCFKLPFYILQSFWLISGPVVNLNTEVSFNKMCIRDSIPIVYEVSSQSHKIIIF